MKFKDKLAAHIVTPKGEAVKNMYKSVIQFEKEFVNLELAIAEVKNLSYKFRGSDLPDTAEGFLEQVDNPEGALCGVKEVDLFTDALGHKHCNEQIYYFQNSSGRLQFIWVEAHSNAFVRFETCNAVTSESRKVFVASQWHPEVIWDSVR
ncbi:MAG: hypothetical protein WCI79_01760 [Candidatus Saccharibacteria bacterium]